MNRLIAIIALSEAAIGMILLIYPQILVQLLFGTDIDGTAVVMSRLAGISLISLAIACFPARKADNSIYRVCHALLAYEADRKFKPLNIRDI